MPAITYGYLPVQTRALRVSDRLNFATTVATQGAYTQSGTAVTDFVMYEGDFAEGTTIVGVSVRLNTPAGGTKPTISVFSLDAQSGTITSLVTPALDPTASGDHEFSVPLTVPVKLTSSQKLVVFVGGNGTNSGTVLKGVLASFVPGP